MPVVKNAHRRTRWFKKTCLATFSTLIALGVGEFAIRLSGCAPEINAIAITSDESAYKRSVNPILGYELKTNFRAPFGNGITKTNAHGQRDVERTIAKPADSRRIILLGDSVVEGFGISAIDALISRQLEELYTVRRTEVLNFGVSGYCTLAEVELLESKGLKFEPDVVVLVFTENDFDNYNQEAWSVGSSIRRPDIVKELFTCSHLFRLSCINLDLFHFGSMTNHFERHGQVIGDNNVADAFRRLRHLVGQHDFSVLIAIWPRFTANGIQDVHFMPDSDELVVEALARSCGLPSVRLSRHFNAHWKSSEQETSPRLKYTIGDRIHPSLAGARIAATAIKVALDELAAQPSGNPAKMPTRQLIVATNAAIETAKSLTTAKPNQASLLIILGNNARSKGEFEKAIQYFEMALKLAPNSHVAHNDLGRVYEGRRTLSLAEFHYQRAITICPDSYQAHTNLGNIYGRQGKVAAAAAQFEQALQIRPDLAPAHFNMGVTYERQQEFSLAARHYQRAIELQADFVEARNGMIRIRRQQESK